MPQTQAHRSHRATLFLLWPQQHLKHPPVPALPPDYTLRAYQPGDEAAWITIQAQADGELPTSNLDQALCSYLATLLPRGLLFVVHIPGNTLVATAGAVHNTRNGMFPFGGELGWVATVPDHQRCGLGTVVSAAATTRLMETGYESIRVGTQDHRLPAIRTYLRLGYQPYLYLPEMYDRWQQICRQLDWPFTPSEWPYQRYESPSNTAM